MATGNVDKRIYGLQFHPEVRHTEHGDQILRNFLFEICQANADWKIETWIPDKIAEIQQIVGEDQAILDYLGCGFPG